MVLLNDIVEVFRSVNSDPSRGPNVPERSIHSIQPRSNGATFVDRRMREYDPTTGRYIQADPLGLVAGVSLYGYARQSPFSYTDL